MARRGRKKQTTKKQQPDKAPGVTGDVDTLAGAEVLRERLGVLVRQFGIQQRNLRLVSEILGQIVGPLRLFLEQVEKDLGKKDLQAMKRVRLSKEATALLAGVDRQVARVLRHVPEPNAGAKEIEEKPEPKQDEQQTRPPVVRVVSEEEAKAKFPKTEDQPNQEVQDVEDRD